MTTMMVIMIMCLSQFCRNHGAGAFHCARLAVVDERSGSCSRLAVVVADKVGKKFYEFCVDFRISIFALLVLYTTSVRDPKPGAWERARTY